MGLFDGRMGSDGWASTAHVARVIGAPVVLVLDISQVSRTAAAWVHGLHTFDPDTRISGVIVNKAGSVRHSDEVVRALEATGIPVLGVLPRDAGIEAPRGISGSCRWPNDPRRPPRWTGWPVRSRSTWT